MNQSAIQDYQMEHQQQVDVNDIKADLEAQEQEESKKPLLSYREDKVKKVQLKNVEADESKMLSARPSTSTQPETSRQVPAT